MQTLIMNTESFMTEIMAFCNKEAPRQLVSRKCNDYRWTTYFIVDCPFSCRRRCLLSHAHSCFFVVHCNQSKAYKLTVEKKDNDSGQTEITCKIVVIQI